MTIILKDIGSKPNTEKHGNVVDLFDTADEFIYSLRDRLSEIQSDMRADGTIGEDEFILPSKRYPTHPKVSFKELWDTYREICGEEYTFEVI